jgi:retron-type reverse transcriptase
MLDRRAIAGKLASVMVNSSWDEAALVERCQHVLASRQAWIVPFVRRQLAQYGRPPRPTGAELETAILNDFGFRRSRLPEAAARRFVTDLKPEMDLRLSLATLLPEICTARELADRLGVSLSSLDSFANLKSLVTNEITSRHHYRYRVLSKSGGALRLIESPKPRLKLVQQQILREILDVVPQHDCVHGFRRGRSISTFVAPHVGQAVVARVDLRDFFPSITRARVAALYRTIGFPEKVALLLAGVCTNIAPGWAWGTDNGQSLSRNRHELSRYTVPHLPQGAPTSPSIANLSAYRLDRRLFALAQAAGGIYTRYADDLAFSGDATFARRIKRFLVHVTATVGEEGFHVHHRKTRIMRRGARQHLAGLIVNERVNIRRDDYDRLKATLTNCVSQGAESQNREGHDDFRAHLSGRVAFVEQVHPARGKRLRKLLKAISW